MLEEKDSKSPIRVRFAPSPTGKLHIGGLRTALFNWVFAKKHNGVFVLRIEDTDLKRSKREYEEDIKQGLNWLGIYWDEGPYRQSERIEIYKKEFLRLKSTNKIYPCFCSQERLKRLRDEMLKRGVPPRYDGCCRDLPPQEVEERIKKGKPCVWRFKVDRYGEISFNDLIKGRLSFRKENIEDFVVLKSDGMPTYNFAVVVDDHYMGITHVIRADDHLSNTPKQIMLYEALGFDVPSFGHLPLVVDTSGKKLSKREGSTDIKSIKDKGILPEAVINALILLGWHHPEGKEFLTLSEIIKAFDLKRVSCSPSVFDEKRLLWLNKKHLSVASEEVILKHLKELGFDYDGRRDILELIKIFKGEVTTLLELNKLLEFAIFKEPCGELNLPIDIEVITNALDSLADWSISSINAVLVDIAKRSGIKIPKLMKPLRKFLIGCESGPSVSVLLYVLGKEDALKILRGV